MLIQHIFSGKQECIQEAGFIHRDSCFEPGIFVSGHQGAGGGELQKLAGLAIVLNDSGRHNGESQISYCGRKRLRYALYEMALSVVGKNKDFQELYRYYVERAKNPLK